MTGRRIWLALLTIFVVSSAIALAIPWLRAGGATSADAAPTATPSVYAVILECSGDLCDRMTDDIQSRTPLTGADFDTAQAAVLAIEQVMPQEIEPDCPTPGGPCGLRYLPTDPDQVRDALAAAGYPDATVRMARAEDPAPAGAVMFAVPIAPACLLGYHVPGTGPSPIRVEGQLPDGTCLPR